MADRSTEEIAERFVDGTSIDASGIAKFGVMSAITGLIAGILMGVESVLALVDSLFQLMVSQITILIGSWFEIMPATLQAGANTTTTTLRYLGVAAYPVAAIMLAVTLYGLWYGVSYVASS